MPRSASAWRLSSSPDPFSRHGRDHQRTGQYKNREYRIPFYDSEEDQSHASHRVGPHRRFRDVGASRKVIGHRGGRAARRSNRLAWEGEDGQSDNADWVREQPRTLDRRPVGGLANFTRESPSRYQKRMEERGRWEDIFEERRRQVEATTRRQHDLRYDDSSDSGVDGMDYFRSHRPYERRKLAKRPSRLCLPNDEDDDRNWVARAEEIANGVVSHHSKHLAALRMDIASTSASIMNSSFTYFAASSGSRRWQF